MKNKKLILVGAGPGDPDLISIKGAKTLAKADVVLYDTLSHPDLLDYAPPNAEKIYVGKKAGSNQNSQEKINGLIVEKASQGNCVVRLKGGDPFIFGRGHEEVDYARAHGIPVEIVPGISSCTSVGELQTIPLTKRGINESFWVTTGVTRKGGVSKDIEKAAQTNATIAILMGMRNLPKIVQIFKNHGKHHTPVAVIQQGSLPEEKIAIGTIDTIAIEVEEHGLTNPALILIGEVVRLHPDFCQKKHSPKNGFLATVQKPFKELNRYMNVGIAGLSF
ncbi:uroporphyrinogen-III C-methyltransferase [Aliifodinibius sp. S!AR15-10]|uniref:uroporphyrinogen-III C-methyltransferase n=1 Tax=Aliifodinibius sp. S!AR15-10 TaxID=2950437 RepID=UPI00286305DC|nr:uroporphyrinogen-III C-methyltransferase [Aliifodinibius sp. S!AR15-10]MDR8394149.1 uroporphyrinogen-III C-methyltransferase [Aliifodinibius sp. S!AR15-10]